MFAFTRNDIDAKVVGNALVVSFLAAGLPKVWRADMTGLASATLEVREGAGKFSVVMKKGDAGEENIVTFGDKESAAFALQTMTKAMLRGDVQAGGAAAAPSGGVFGKVVKVVLVLVVLAVVGSWLLKPGGMRPGMDSPEKAGGASLVQPGAPVPADQLFGGGDGK